jgi:hypothetical protein
VKQAYEARVVITLEQEDEADLSKKVGLAILKLLDLPSELDVLQRIGSARVAIRKATRYPCGVETCARPSTQYARDDHAKLGHLCTPCWNALPPEEKRHYYSAFEPTPAQET